MAILDVTPMLIVPDVPAAVRFYVETLGFTAGNVMEGWAMVQRDGVEIMFSAPNPHTPFEKPMFTGYFYFRTDDVGAIWEELRDRVEVVYPMEEFAYGMREFAVRDLNGYVLQFGQELE